MNKYYLEETEMVLNGMETAEVGRKLGLSHSTISLRVRKTLQSLARTEMKISVKEARLDKENWLKRIADHRFKNRPEEQVLMEGRTWQAMLALVGSFVNTQGYLPTKRQLKYCKEIAEDIAGM